MGLKDVVERLAGKKQTKQLGSRRAPERKRGRDEETVQVQSPIAHRGPATPAAGSTPSPTATEPASRPAPAPPPAAREPAPAAQPPPPAAPPPTPTAAPPPSPRPARPSADSAEATQYVTIPGMPSDALVGVLVGIEGKLAGEIHKIFDRDMKVGRAEDCDIKLLDERISREHAKLVAVDGDLMVVPLSDRNPVFVNDQAVEDAEQVSDGDKLQLGNVGTSVFRYRTIEGP